MKKRIWEVSVRCGECGELMVSLQECDVLSCPSPCSRTVSYEELFFEAWNEVKRRLSDPEAIARGEEEHGVEQGTFREIINHFLEKADAWLSREGKEAFIEALVREIRVFADRVEYCGYSSRWNAVLRSTTPRLKAGPHRR